jgi:hypothetical protein
MGCRAEFLIAPCWSHQALEGEPPMIRYTLALMLLLSLVLPATAVAQATDDCPMTPTIGALSACVQHAVDMGHITNKGVARSLFAEVKTAQTALDRGQQSVAIALLRVFVREVKALSGRFIEPAHAAHMVEHAQLVIQALQR